ncbi:hypothetical protein KC19_2G052700 [Ceratodon purpureus]|uniref:S-acyltransferase n=1 Tax=Ceratodon purpureus TaxID=3225 RepID=A0A8T0ISE4_CERPU|nr:hypothetical protein KC19_2G052700 [Ceratodon purpureus]
MRNHGWQPPFHPLQTVAIAVFCALAFSFYVFFAPFLGTETLKFVIIGLFTPLVGAVFILYITCTWIDPADPGVHRSHEKYSPKKEETGSGTDGQPSEQGKKSIKTILEEGPEDNLEPPEANEKSALRLLADKSCCKGQQEPGEKSPDEEVLYCSICDADISAHSKHCRACDKCVHGFDHHCRWLNNCVGTRNYKPFVALMVSCLLMLILEWAVGIVVLVRCFRDATEFNQEIVDKLGSSFPRVAFIVVLIFLTLLALLATAPLTQLFCFHLILMQKGITTYDYILAVREENQEFLEETGGLSSTTSPATSTDTAFSGYNSHSSAGGRRIVFCTPPRMFVDQDQTIMALSDLEVGVGKTGGGKIIDAKSQQRPSGVGLNPFKLARVTTEDATRAAARARAKSSILLPNRPGTAVQDANVHSDSGFQSSSGSEIRLAGSRRSHKKRNVPGLPSDMFSKTKQDRVSPLGSEDADTPNLDSSIEGLPQLPLEPRSPYRPSPGNDPYSGDPRASFPPPAPAPRFPGQVRPEDSVTQLSSSAEVMRISVNSDGYEASCGESGDETSEAVGLSESWTQDSWKKVTGNPVSVGIKEENNKPWVASFNVQNVQGSPGGECTST